MKKYCHLCGAIYVDGKEQPWECSGCGNLSYRNASPTADILLFNEEEEVLIAKRGIEPAKGKYDIPGGFVDLNETFEEAMAREGLEELGLSPKNDYSEPVFVQSTTADYKFSKEIKPVLGVTFAARLLTDKEIKPQDDVAAIRFVAIENLDNIDFSLPQIPEIIRKAHKLLFRD